MALLCCFALLKRVLFNRIKILDRKMWLVLAQQNSLTMSFLKVETL